jgi:hypothetical protein
MKVDIHPEAEAELEATFNYYNSRRAGLGHLFVEEYLDGVHQIAAAPKKWPEEPSDPRCRRYRFDQFPYKIVYGLSADRCTIVAVADQRREPGYWRHRI